MWILSQDKKNLINLDNTIGAELIIRGNVGQIVVNDKAYPTEIGEYRDYAAEKIFTQMALLAGESQTFFMPDEKEANEQYK